MPGWRWSAAAWLGLIGLAPACAQVTLIARTPVKPRLTVFDTLTVTALPTAVNFALVPDGMATGSAPVAITTSWTGVSLLASFTVYGYFSSASAALSGGIPVSSIPSANVLGRVSTGVPTSYTAFTQTSPFGGAGSSLLLVNVGTILSLGGSRTDNLNLEIDLTTLPQLPAAVYSGTLILQAQAF